MKKLMTAIVFAFAAVFANAAIEVRDVTFPADEVPATNPRIERKAGVITHIEVFGQFVEQDDGTFKTKVADTSTDMDAVAAAAGVKEARKALGLATPRQFSKIHLKIAVAKLGKLQALEEWLASFEVAPGYTALAAWNDANVIADDFDGFERFYEEALGVLGITKELGDTILSQCISTSN